MVRLNISIFIFFIFFTYKGSSQGLYEEEQMSYLLNSGKSKVKVFVNGAFTSIWHIDSSAKTITMHALESSVINPTAPKYDNK